MSDDPIISVIIPIHQMNSKILEVRKVLESSSVPIELIVVINNKELQLKIKPEYPYERVVISNLRGRGYAFIKGVLEAKGRVILLLHSDTILPIGWENAIMNLLENSGIVGGGFSLSFDIPSIFLNMLTHLSDLYFYLTGEMWSDRAMFVRSEVLKECLLVMDVPIFEDVRLSNCLKRFGKVSLLKEKVKTSGKSFQKNRKYSHLLKIVKCRLLYTLGGDIERIYNYYYAN